MSHADADHVRTPNTLWSSLALVGSNLIPIVGVFYYDWDVFTLMLLFWMENVIIGLFNVLRILTSMSGNIADQLGKIFLVPFFTVHYGGFCFGHGLFVFALFAPSQYESFGNSPIGFVGLLPEILTGSVVQLALIGLIASHGISFVLNYLMGGEYRNTNPAELMIRPYGRIVLLHVVLIFGGFLAAITGETRAALLLFVLLKIGMDIAAHRFEHRGRERGGAQGHAVKH